MLHRPISRLLSLGVVSLTLTLSPGPVPADVYFETAYVPTSSVLSLSSPLLPTSYVVPTVYSSSYIPTSYVPTSAVIASDPFVYPTSTTIVRRSLFRPRRYVERTFYSYPLTPTSYLLPTSYVVPTSYVSTSSLLPTTYLSSSILSPTSYVIDNGVVTTSASSYPCETSSSTSSPAKSTASRSTNANETSNPIISQPSNGSTTNERRPQGMVNGAPAVEETLPPREIPPPATVPTTRPETPPSAPPLQEPDPSNIKVPEPGKSGAVPPQGGETSFRSVRRPTYDGRNILRGRVISAESRRPEEGVTVIISNVTKSYTDRPAMTDADGEFKISLPDGDWTVKVKMPSGTVYPVGRDYVTASNGRVVDSSGRNVAEFLITR